MNFEVKCTTIFNITILRIKYFNGFQSSFSILKVLTQDSL